MPPSLYSRLLALPEEPTVLTQVGPRDLHTHLVIPTAHGFVVVDRHRPHHPNEILLNMGTKFQMIHGGYLWFLETIDDLDDKYCIQDAQHFAQTVADSAARGIFPPEPENRWPLELDDEA